MDRTPDEVARTHLDAVESGDVVAMAADYAPDAVLERGADRFVGHGEIAAYFETVPERLGEARVVFDALQVEGAEAVFEWHLEPSAAPVSGRDVCRIVDGFIVHQVVHLTSTDF